MVCFIKCTSNFPRFNVQFKMTFINASYLNTVLHMKDTEVNEAKAMQVLLQYRLMRNRDIKGEMTSVVRINEGLSVGLAWVHRDHALLFLNLTPLVFLSLVYSALFQINVFHS